MKKFLSIVLMVLLVMSPVMMVEAKTTTTSKTTTSTKKTTTKKSTKTTTTKKTTTEEASESKNSINIYVFYSSTCPHCTELHEFLSELKEDKTYGKMFKVIDYEVSDSQNSDLMYEVVSHFKQTYSGVPIYVIGNQYMSGFAKDVHGDQVKEAIKKAYDEQPEDEVAKLIQELGNKKDSSAVGYVVLAIAVVVIIGVIYSSSKNKYYDDEVDSAEELDTKSSEVKNETNTVETKEVESKKTDSKKTSSTTKKNSTKKKSTKKKA